MVKDSYLSVESASCGEYKEKGSKFIAIAVPFDDESKLDEILSEIKNDHPKARHYCYAWQIGINRDKFRMNDDGEPSGTAGKPIFGQIQSFNLSNVAIVVVRYFGGTKLGVSGLTNAYKMASRAAIENAIIIEKFLFADYNLIFDYSNMGHILSVLKEKEIQIIQKSFENSCLVHIRLRISEETNKLKDIKSGILNISREEISDNTEISFCTIKKVSGLKN